jgi:hypothetical protein
VICKILIPTILVPLGLFYLNSLSMLLEFIILNDCQFHFRQRIVITANNLCKWYRGLTKFIFRVNYFTCREINEYRKPVTRFMCVFICLIGLKNVRIHNTRWLDCISFVTLTAQLISAGYFSAQYSSVITRPA